MENSERRNFLGKLALIGGFIGLGSARAAEAQAPARQFIKRDASQASGYSQAVITQGGKTIWLAGHAAGADASGKSLAGDFEGQVRAVFAFLEDTLKKSGGKLSDMVTMTVFITDPRNHKTFTNMRREILGDNFPASASIAISHLATPALLLEIQGVAVIA
jgi:2-iminobutanoate/2-iminopropanoate deaminase